jgi:hypothetical protein
MLPLDTSPEKWTVIQTAILGFGLATQLRPGGGKIPLPLKVVFGPLLACEAFLGKVIAVDSFKGLKAVLTGKTS